MPRLATIAHPALRAIAEDQRYAPKPAALRAVGRIEQLAREIDASALYPHDYIVFRVTGYRPDVSQIELINGSALLADLSALCETLCAHARLGGELTRDDTLTFEELLERWGVSRRTLDRDRRRGLIARRVRSDDNTERLVFSRATVESFEREHPGRARDDDQPPKRLTDGERAQIVRRADRYAESLDLSRHAIAGRIASHLGRSVNAVRAVIDAHDDDTRTPIDPRRERVLLAKWERGHPIETLADCAQRSRATTHRLLLRARLDRLEGLGDPGELLDPAAESDALDESIAQRNLDVPVPTSPDAVRTLAEALSHAPPDEERTIALAHRAVWRRCASLVRTLERDAPPARLVDRAETDARWASMLRERLAWCALPMVLRTIEERAACTIDNLPSANAMDLVERAMTVALASAVRYDPAAGGRLSGRASLAVDQVVVRALRERDERAASGSAAAIPSVTPGGWREHARVAPGLVSPPPWLTGGLDRLDRDQRRLLALRFGLEGDRPLSVVEIAQRTGVHERSVWASLRSSVVASRAR